jgi:uncharacterized protein (TIGR02145 family)
MKSLKFAWFISCSLICIFVFGCKSEEIILHGEVGGVVTDALSNQPINAAMLTMSPSNDTTYSEEDGQYIFKSCIPGNYNIQVSKFSYGTEKQEITISSVETQQIDFALNLVPVPNYSKKNLDFGPDLDSLSFIISNLGKGEISYMIRAGQNWIKTVPSMGIITDKSDSIKVIIDRTGLSENTYKEMIVIIAIAGREILQDTVNILLNGVMDRDGNYYKIVKIGDQTWMAENLKVGKHILNIKEQENNGIIEKYCYNNDLKQCDIYGGLYKWNEMMQYNPPENGITGTTKGVCPDGWHLPTNREFTRLVIYCGGYQAAGENLKEAGTIEDGTGYWHSPNFGADNESGFSGRPGGEYSSSRIPAFQGLGFRGSWYGSSDIFPFTMLYNTRETLFAPPFPADSTYACSVRCIKDPPKNK